MILQFYPSCNHPSSDYQSKMYFDFAGREYSVTGCHGKYVYKHDGEHILAAGRVATPTLSLCSAIYIPKQPYASYFLNVSFYNEVLPTPNRVVGSGLLFNVADADNAEFVVFRYGETHTRLCGHSRVT